MLQGRIEWLKDLRMELRKNISGTGKNISGAGKNASALREE